VSRHGAGEVEDVGRTNARELRCRECEARYPLEARAVCEEVLRPGGGRNRPQAHVHESPRVYLGELGAHAIGLVVGAEGSKTLAFEAAEQLGWAGSARRDRPRHGRGPFASVLGSHKGSMVEVRGIEPLSLGDRSGLLRAQPADRSRLEAPAGGGPLGQPGCDVRRRPPGGATPVSLLTTPIPRSQASRGGRLPSYLGSERVFRIGACVGPGFYRGIRGPRPASPERDPSRSKPVHPHMRLSPKV
jgi:hypothetical protein